MKNFLEALENNEELKAKIAGLKDKAEATVEDVAAIAKEHGVDLNLDEVADKIKDQFLGGGKAEEPAAEEAPAE